VPDSSRNKTRGTTPKGLPSRDQGPGTSLARVGISALLVALGIAWIAVYINVAQDGDKLSMMGDLGRWNFLIGFGLMFTGLAAAAHPSTPLGRGRGVVTGMLGCFILGLIWIVVYYVAGSDTSIPVLRNLEQYNLVVGIGFMAVGFVYATRWE
jgi:hypothetical protein